MRYFSSRRIYLTINSLYVEQLDLKNECGIRRNDVCYAFFSVGLVSRDGKLTAFANRHADHTFVPTGDDLART